MATPCLFINFSILHAQVVHVHDEPPPPFYAWPPQLKGLKVVRLDENTEALFKSPHITADADPVNVAKSTSSSPSTFDLLLEEDPPDVASAIEGPVRDWAFAWASKLQLLYSGRAPKDQAATLQQSDQEGREDEQTSPRSLPPPLVLRTYLLAGGAAAASVATGNDDGEAARVFSTVSNSSSSSADRPTSAHGSSTPDDTADGRHQSSETSSSKEQRLFVVPVGWYTGFLGDYESGPAAVLKYLGTGNKIKGRGGRRQHGHRDKPRHESKGVGDNGGEGGDLKEGDGRTNLWSFAGLRSYRFAAVTPHRHAMVNLFRGLGNTPEFLPFPLNVIPLKKKNTRTLLLLSKEYLLFDTIFVIHFNPWSLSLRVMKTTSGAPHSIHLVDASAPIDVAPPLDAANQLLAPSAVRDMYQRALVVPSPRGILGEY